jgi:hypothetical protein
VMNRWRLREKCPQAPLPNIKWILDSVTGLIVHAIQVLGVRNPHPLA